MVSVWLALAAPAHARHRWRRLVIDGDTLEIHGQRIRLHGIDRRRAAELPGRPARNGAAAAAALALQDLIGRRTVPCDERDVDRYWRILGRCLVGELDINE